MIDKKYIYVCIYNVCTTEIVQPYVQSVYIMENEVKVFPPMKRLCLEDTKRVFLCTIWDIIICDLYLQNLCTIQ